MDGGSCENMVSEELVNKLNLHRHKLDEPYKILWFKKGGEIMVSYKALVPIQLGRYSDEVLCDVVPMDACHLLLERPWQYDQQAVHDGRLNTYTIIKEGKHFTLWPTEEDEAVQVVLLTKQLIRNVRVTGVCYALIAKEVREEKSTGVPKEVRRLLKEYSDITPDELPTGLPPDRGISHQIDLIQGSS